LDEHARTGLNEAPRPIAPGADPRRLYILIGVLVGIIVLLVVRPWGEGSGVPPGVSPDVLAGGSPTLVPGATGAGTPVPADPYADLWVTCGSPSGWRAATIQDWGGRVSSIRTWIAIDPVAATGPLDTAIPFAPVATSRVTAIGFCSPLDEERRPPLTATAALWAIEDGVATALAPPPLEPSTPNALGGLWRPPPGIGGGAAWVPGRYVIEIGSPTGGYRRWLGIEIRDLEREREQRTEPPSPRASGSPGASASPPGSPGATPAPDRSG
jgi:hypothetical protein